MQTRFHILLIHFLLGTIGINGQQALSYSGREITYQNDNSIDAIKHMCQDTIGRLWFAGSNTSVKNYDGNKVESFSELSIKKRGTSLNPMSSALSIAINKMHNIVFCTNNGLYEYNPYANEMVDSFFTDSSVKGFCNMVVDSVTNQVWLVNHNPTKNKETWLVRSQSNHTLEKIRKFNIETRANLIDYNGHIWVPGVDTIHAVDKVSLKTKSYPLYDEGKLVRPFGLAVDNQNVLWVKSRSENRPHLSSALFKIDVENDRFEKVDICPKHLLQPTKVISIKNDEMWLGGQTNVVFKIDLASLEIEDYTDHARQLLESNFEVFNIGFDGQKTPYFLTEAGIIQMRNYQPPKHSLCSVEHNYLIFEGEERIQSVAAIDSNVYFCTLYDLFKLDLSNNSWQKLPIALTDTFLYDNIANKWDFGSQKLTSFDDKLLWNDKIIDPNSLEHFDILPPNVDYRITNYVQDGRFIWLAPFYNKKEKGYVYLYEVETRALKDISPDKINPNGRPLMFLESEYSDKMYLLYQQDGIYEFDKKGNYIRNIVTGPAVHNCIFQSSAGFLWSGNHKGLMKINLENLHTQNYYDGSYDHQGKPQPKSVESIVQTNDSIIWISSSSSIHRFNLNSEKFETPPLSEDLNKLAYNNGKSIFNPELKKTFFSTNQGLLYFSPEDFENVNVDRSNYPIAITEIQTINKGDSDITFIYKDLSKLSTFTLPFNHSWFSLNYALPFLEADKIFYSHKLENYDRDWINQDQNNSLTYSNLRPGKYTLVLRASIREESPDDYMKEIKITVKQVWFKRWWAILIWLSVAIGLIYTAALLRFRERLKKQKELDDLKTKISMDLHDDVGTSLTALSMQTDLLELSISEKHHKRTKLINELSNKARTQMRDAVWAMDNRKNNWQALFDRIEDFAHSVFEESPTKFSFSTEGNIHSGITTLVRQNLYLILKEAIGNVVKHSNADEVNCRFRFTKSRVFITFEDNGGNLKPNQSSGLGLSNIEDRVKVLDGNFEIVVKNGFSIKIEVPLN